jgi:hypothetical protein
VAEPKGSYDEEQWQSSFAEAETAGAAEAPAMAETDAPEEAETGPVPRLEELLPMIPARNRELLEGLFRGRFVDVQRLNRKKLY